MNTYKLLDEGFEAVKKQIRNILFGVFLFIVAVVLFVMVGDTNLDTPSLLFSLPLTLVIIGFAFYLGFRKSLNIQQERWSSYELRFDNDVIIRKQTRSPDVEIPRNEIIGLQQAYNGSLIIKTKDRHKFIIIPASLENYEEVKRYLTIWQELEVLSQNWFLKQKFIWFLLLFMIGLGIAFVSQNIRIVLPIGFFLIGFFIWSAIEQQRNPEIDSKLKRNTWISVGVVTIIIVLKAVILWTG